ncbi:MAG: XdhC family protein [Bacteroidetes bacterium]|nr:XdhC family protein [Bacteroidota bacterium]
MKEIKSVLSFYDTHKSDDLNAAMALVVRVEQSSYRREGARMLVFDSGIFEGGISGGCLEGDALKRSQIAIMKEKPSVVTYDTSTDDENQIGVGLGCNGVIDVLISPIRNDEKNLNLLRKCTASRQSHILATVIRVSGKNKAVKLGDTYYFDVPGKQLEGCEHEILASSIREAAKVVVERQKSKRFEFTIGDAEISIFMEWIPPQIHLAVFGDNYDVYPLLEIAGSLDWDLSLTGNVQKLKKQKLAKVTGLYPKTKSARPETDNRTALVLMAHDYKTDLANLKAAVQGDASYIAVLGPKKRFDKMVEEMETEGIVLTEEQKSRIYSPCGLDIGATTPEEIAISIVSEVIAVFAGKKGGSLREKDGPIHDRD